MAASVYARFWPIATLSRIIALTLQVLPIQTEPMTAGNKAK